MMPPNEPEESSASEEVEQEQEEKTGKAFRLLQLNIAPPEPPAKVGDEEALAEDDGVVKKVLEAGTGIERPSESALVTVIYKGYFAKTGEVFDSSEEKPVQVELGDPAKVDGFHIGLESMTKGEKAKLTIKSRFAFRNDKPGLKIPEKFVDKATVIKKRRVVYEVKLLDFVSRVDINKDKRVMKTILKPGIGTKMPKEVDDIKITLSVEQNGKTILKKDQWLVSVDSDELCLSMKRVLISMKKQEYCFADIKADFMEKNEKEYCLKYGIDPMVDARVYIELHNFMRVEDYFRDYSTLRKVFRRGKKDTNPYMESTVEFKMKVLINGELKFSNLDVKPLVLERKRDFLGLDAEVETKIIPTNPETLKYKLDEYKLPPILTKGLREMDCDELVELATTRVEKLVPYFPEDIILPPEWFHKGDRVRIFLYLVNTDRPDSLSKVPITEKHKRLSTLKATATRLYKVGKCKKAAKLYQKISGYYNFGDVDVLAEGESNETEEYKKLREDLQVIHKQCNTNLLVCRYKLKDYGTVISLADIILDSDPKCTKAYYYKGKALYDSEMYAQAVKAMKAAYQLEPNNEDVKKEYFGMKEGYEKFMASEKQKYSKLFK